MPRLTLLLAFLVLVLAAPARADTGRVSFPVGLPAPRADFDAAGAGAAASLPGGGAILVGDDRGRGIVAAAIDADGGASRRAARTRIVTRSSGCCPTALPTHRSRAAGARLCRRASSSAPTVR